MRWLALIAFLLLPVSAEAFCGFYVAPGDAKLVADATMVVLMREGTRTVMSMQNDYQGPPDDFAMVIPVPVVLHKENVKTLEAGIFSRVDALAGPRLVEYWEQDPCPALEDESSDNKEGGTGTRAKGEEGSMGNPRGRYGIPLVRVDAKFAVGEYEIVILSADDAMALDQWLRDNHYKIPAGAEDALRPYVAAGSKFFVAKVDSKQVRFVNGRTRLSPLRFHYDSETFSLPVRLGLLNSAGHQDLVVHVIGHSRFDVANYPKATLPTNLEVDNAVRGRFPEIYAALFDATLAKHPGAVVTEYAWDTGSCDPCPTPPLSDADMKILGTDVTNLSSSNWVLTRLHARYTKDQLGADLVFAEAAPLEGGRESWSYYGSGPQNSTEAVQSSSNNFQTRLIIRHLWEGPIVCSSPQRGMWGGPPSGRQRLPPKLRDPTVVRGKIELGNVLRTRVDSIGVQGIGSGLPEEENVGSKRGRALGLGLLLGLAISIGLAFFIERQVRATPRTPDASPRGPSG